MKPTAASVANSKPEPKAARPRLSPEKGNELKGVLQVTLGLLLLASLLSYQPSDPSILHLVADGSTGTRNWIGLVGAQLAAVAVGLLGLTALAAPLFLLVAGGRRLRRREVKGRVSHGIGAAILLLTLPGLLQLTVADVEIRGAPLDAGGALGKLLVAELEGQLNFMGALLVLVALVAVASTLLVQSTLSETVSRWLAGIKAWWQERALAKARKREQKEKERARKRVEAKHVERALEEKRLQEERQAVVLSRPPLASLATDLPLRPREASVLDGGQPGGPVRVLLRRGEPAGGLRRVGAAGPAADEPELPDEPILLALPAAVATPRAERAAKPRPARPQADLPFAPPPEGANPLPPVNLLQITNDAHSIDENELVRMGEVIRLRCAEFGVEGTIEGIGPGPVITVFEFQPAPGVKVSQIVNLQDDLALALKAESVRIDRLPGRSTLGIEVPNRVRQTIRLGSLLAKEAFARTPSVLTMALGVTIHGDPYYADLATMPHLLVAGATGAGKSVGLQSMITSIIYKARREEVQFIFIDPKRIELGVYADVPCLRTPVVVEPKQAANVLNHMVAEMENRYRKLAKVHVRSIAHYNQAIRDPEQRRRLALNEGEGELSSEDFQPLPYFVIIIDELADLMMVASADVETAIARLAQMARAVGIHLIVATQRPSVDVLTGTIKANFPCRISYATASRHDSRTILDQVGSEKLLGRGDMLFMPAGTSRVLRLHGAYVSEQETAALVRWLKKQGKPEYDLELLEPIEGSRAGGEGGDNDDELFDEAARLVVAERMASASFLQRRMRIGFSRASRLIDVMEREGLLGPPQGSKPREVLVPRDYFEEVDAVKAGV